MKTNHAPIVTILAAVLLGSSGVEAHEMYSRHSAEAYENMAAEVGNKVRECNLPNTILSEFRYMASLYSENPVRADQNYRSKVLRGAGYVRHIGKDRNGAIHVVIETWDGGGEGSPEEAIVCYFPKSEADSVAKLYEGTCVFIRGECTGNGSGWVVLLGCHIDEVVPYKR